MDTVDRHKRWRLANPERWSAHQRKSRMKRRKPCQGCRGPMPYPSPGAKFCSDECRDEARRQLDRERRVATRQLVDKHKTGIGCSKCGYCKTGAALDWHHVDDNKERRITITSYFSPLGAAEREKCILLCANCHREEHA